MDRTQLLIPPNTELPLSMPGVLTAGAFVVSVPAGHEEEFADLLRIDPEIVEMVESMVTDENDNTIHTLNGEVINDDNEDFDEDDVAPTREPLEPSHPADGGKPALGFLQALGMPIMASEPVPTRIQTAMSLVAQFLHYRYHHGAHAAAENPRNADVESLAAESLLYTAAAQAIADWLREKQDVG